MDKAAFRKAFPEFTDIVKYPDSQLDFWATFAEAQVNTDRWGTQATLGVQLYVAHEVTLAAQSAKAAAIGGVPGQQGGPINSKTVGTVTASYDTQVASEKDAGHWNLTSYGRQFHRLSRIFGAGVVQL